MIWTVESIEPDPYYVLTDGPIKNIYTIKLKKWWLRKTIRTKLEPNDNIKKGDKVKV